MKKRFLITLALAALMSLICFTAYASIGDNYELEVNGNVNLRKGPGTSYGIVATASDGDLFYYEGYTKKDSSGGYWHRVLYRDRYVWISNGCCTVFDSNGNSLERKKSVQATSKVNLRREPSSSSRYVSYMAKGSKLFYLGDTRTYKNGYSWYKVATSKGIAWVSASYSKLTTSSGGGGGGGGSTKAEYVVISTGNVNLRRGPGTRYSVYCTVHKGTQVAYTGYSENDRHGTEWYEVKYKGRTLWVSSKYAYIKKQ